MFRAGRAGASAVLLVTLAGCSAAETGQDGAATGDAADDSAAAAAPAAPTSAIAVTREIKGVDVEVSVSPVEVRDDVAVLTADYAVASEYAAAFDEKVNNLAYVLDGDVTGDRGSAHGIRLVDGGNGVVAPVADSEDRAASDFAVDEEDDGFRAQSRSVHAAPQGDTVDVLLPSLGYVAGVPVVDAGEEFDPALADLAPSDDPTTFEIESYRAAYDEASSTKSQGEQVTVTLTSDVLFASSSAQLSSKASKGLSRAVDQITGSADGGQVRVVGHTDDVDTDAFNQKLSERRAATVASRLQEGLGDGYTVSHEGRGESEPIAEGTSDEARTANRRVEIVFDGQVVRESEPEPSATTIPGTKAPTGAAGEPVEVEAYDGVTYAVAIDSVMRSHGAVFGTVRAELTGGDGNAQMFGLFKPGEQHERSTVGRGFSALDTVLSVHDFALLTEEGRLYPFDYDVAGEGDDAFRRIVGDDLLSWAPEDTGEAVLATAVWPDTGQDTVTLEVAGKFRITDIPVTDGAGSD